MKKHPVRIPSRAIKEQPTVLTSDDPEVIPDFSRQCQCGASPILPLTGMCGPCTFGEAETAGGNW